ncbi:MAG: aminomethyltransferase family protein [Chloroflexota bacterium]
MPLPTPFHSRTSAVCDSFEWRNWSGFLSASLYEPTHDREYYAIRNSAGLIDVSPLFKYEVTGPDAARLVDRVITRDVTRQKVGQVYYTPWCDAHGKVIDDGTVSRLDTNHFRITSADPNGRWFQDVGYGLNAQVKNVTDDLAALALQGPRSRAILEEFVQGIDFDKLKYFYLAQGTADGFPITVTRTGYTGDLGYELWVRPEHAERLWDCLLDRGSRHGILPAGIIALDIARVEAGLIMIAVDYISSHHAVIESQKSSPYEIGLGWAVKPDKGDFIGRRALIDEKEKGSTWTFVGLQYDWQALERLYAEEDLPPGVAGRASRSAVPVYEQAGGARTQIGQITSHTFAPILKQYIGIGTLLTPHARLGDQVDVEVTVEFKRKLCPATIVPTPFFDPARKKG